MLMYGRNQAMILQLKISIFLKREKNRCISKSVTQAPHKTKQARTPCPQHKGISQLPLQPSFLARQGPGLPHQLYPLPGPRQTPPLPALACLGGAPPAPSASCQLSTGRVPHAAGCRSGMSLAPPPPPRPACHLNIWATAWVPPSLLLQAVGRATDHQSWEPGEGAHWQDPREKEQSIGSLPPPPPTFLLLLHRPLGRVTALPVLSPHP